MCTDAWLELVNPVVVNPTICPWEPSVWIDATGTQSEMSAKNRTWYFPVELLNFPVKLGFGSTFGDDAMIVPFASRWAKNLVPAGPGGPAGPAGGRGARRAAGGGG